MRYSTNRVTRYGRAVVAVLAIGVGVLVHAATKGPDAGGYTATDATVYSFIDLSGESGGASLMGSTDDGLAALTLPFAFKFYGQSYTTVCVSTNGALYFVSAAGACANVIDFANTDLTSTATPNDWPAVLPFWSDLTFDQPGAGAVFYQTLGAPGARKFVVQWQNAFPQGSQNPVTFQVVLTEDANTVLVQYKTVDLGPGNPATKGARATIGIRNAGAPASNRQLQWSFDVPVVSDATALLFKIQSEKVPPSVTVAVTPSELWPPSGRRVQVTVSGSMTDAGSGVDPSTAQFAVTDEYGTVQPTGSITVRPDGRFTLIVSLVASRIDSDKDGRTYTVVVTGRDFAGNAGSARAIVTVPHDQRKR